MKNIFLLITFLFSFCFCFSQNDSNTVIALQNKLVVFQNNNQLDSVLFYEKQALIISTEINYKRGIAHALGSLGLVYKYKGKLSPVELQSKNIEKQQYILSKIKNLQQAKRIAHQELITGLPNWGNEYDVIHK